MHDMKQLEQLWEQYNKHRRRPYYIYAVFSIMVIVGIIFLLLQKYTLFGTMVTPHTKKETSSSNMPVTLSKNFLLNDALIDLQEHKILENEETKMPQTDDTISIEEDELIPTLPVVDSIPIIDNEEEPIVKRRQKKASPQQRKGAIQKVRKKKHLKITTSTSQHAYREVEKRFNQFNDPDDSLFLAKLYYQKKQYEKSEYWALRTNKINKNLEESWLILIKSKIKMGYKHEAIDLLVNYIKQSNSKEAKNLLLKLKN